MAHITVAIPAYNREHLIGRTIECILQQEFSDYDVFVVDDASTDNTVGIVNQYINQDSRIKLVVNQKNLGMTRNWNRCLNLADGDLIQLMFSDDFIDADYLKLVSEKFDSMPEVGFVASSCRYIDVEDNIIHPGYSLPPSFASAGDEAVSWFLKNGFPHMSSIVVRRQCYEELGKFDERIWHGPDVEMDSRLASKYNFYHFGSIHTSFRRHGSNMGNLGYLIKDYLEVDRLKKSKAWGYLSPEGLKRFGIDDFDKFINNMGAQVALIGAIATIAYNRPDLSRYYLYNAFRLNSNVWRMTKFWKAVGLNVLPGLGHSIMERRMKISQRDQVQALTVEQSYLSFQQIRG